MTIAAFSSPAMRPLLCVITLLVVGLCPAQPQADKSEKAIHIPSSGGEVLIATATEKAVAYDQYHYSPARRVGDTLYISGVVVGRREGEGKDIAAFSAVKDEFMKAPYPAWTAVGTTALIPDTGIVEIQAIVHLKN
jgi:enamine deaminase RidA (YjgF/YER057c/UK114 family)